MTEAKCADCGLPYEDNGFVDLVVPHKVWNEVLSPTGDEGGLLCPTCLCRAAVRAGIQCEASFGADHPFSVRAPEGSVVLTAEEVQVILEVLFPLAKIGYTAEEEALISRMESAKR